MSEHATTRTRLVPATGTRLLLLAGLLLLIFAAYLALVPLSVQTPDGKLVGCRTAFDPPTQALGKSLCGDTNEVRQYQTGLFAVAGLLVAVSGFLVFGMEHRVERRQPDVSPPGPQGPLGT